MRDMNVKIYGAGPIGCHLAYNCRCAGINVSVKDIDKLALDRMKNDIYPVRYGSWDDEIEHGINTMLVICAVFRSIEEKRTIRINYDEMDSKQVLTLID